MAGRKVAWLAYRLSLQLVDVESGLAEWMDEKEIRKTTER